MNDLLTLLHQVSEPEESEGAQRIAFALEVVLAVCAAARYDGGEFVRVDHIEREIGLALRDE